MSWDPPHVAVAEQREDGGGGGGVVQRQCPLQLHDGRRKVRVLIGQAAHLPRVMTAAQHDVSHVIRRDGIGWVHGLGAVAKVSQAAALQQRDAEL